MPLKHIDEVLTHYLTAFETNNLKEILKDYTEASVIFTPTGLLKGLEPIRRFFEGLFILVPKGSKFEMKQKTIENHVAYMVWASESAQAKITMSADTFVIENGKIKYHTVAFHRIDK